MKNNRFSRRNIRKNVIVLNSDYSFLNVVHWRKAINLIVKGKVEVLEFTEKVLRNAEKTVKIVIPKIVRLVKMIRAIFKARVPYSKRNVFIRDKYQCAYCGIQTQKPTVDHIVPRSRGGRSTFENTVTACKPCNTKKQDMTPRECGMFLKIRPTQPTIMEFLQIRIEALGVNDVLDEFFETCKA